MDLTETVMELLETRGGPAAFEYVTAELLQLAPAERGTYGWLLAITGQPQVVDWIDDHLQLPVPPEWGLGIAMAGAGWPRLNEWIQSGPPYSLAALSALVAYAAPKPDWSTLHRQVAPVLPDPPEPEPFLRLLRAYADAEPTPRVKEDVAFIEAHVSEILRGGAPAIAPSELPAVAIGDLADSPSTAASFLDHLTARLGPVASTWHGSPDAPDAVNVLRFAPGDGHDFCAILTQGLCAAPIPGGLAPLELMFALPVDWFGDDDIGQELDPEERSHQPVLLLQWLADFAAAGESGYPNGQTIALPDPMADYDGAMVLTADATLGDLLDVPLAGGFSGRIGVVHLLRKPELDLKLRDVDAFERAWSEAGLPPVFDPDRASFVRAGRSWWRRRG